MPFKKVRLEGFGYSCFFFQVVQNSLLVCRYVNSCEATSFVSSVISSESPIRCYSLESIMKSKPRKIVKSNSRTKNEFLAFYENSFLFLRNARTVVGVDGKTQVSLVIENIITKKASTF